MSASAIKDYFATLPAAKVPDVAPQFVSNAGAGLLEEKPAKVGIYRPPKVVRGLDVAVTNDFAKDPSVLPTLKGLPLDDMNEAIKKLSRRVEDLHAKAVMFRRPPMLLQADLKPEFKMSDIVTAFQQSRRMDQELLFREGLLKEGVTPEEIRALEAQQRIQRALGRVAAPAPVAAVAAAPGGRGGRRAAAALPVAAAGAFAEKLAEPGAMIRRRPGRPRRDEPMSVAESDTSSSEPRRIVRPEPPFIRRPTIQSFQRREDAREGSVLAQMAAAAAEEQAAVLAARATIM
jgi:hypothetical protein